MDILSDDPVTDRIRASLLAGAIGDALGAPVERASLASSSASSPSFVATTSLPHVSCAMPWASQKRTMESRPAFAKRALKLPGL